MSRIVVALGGNALQQSNAEATSDNQLMVIRETASYIVDLIEQGEEVIIVHGNGPQVGRIVIQNEVAKGHTPAMPLDVCDGMSQGMIGYHIEQALNDELYQRQLDQPVACIVTQVVVDPEDSAFTHPTKPIGPFYTEEEAKVLEEQGYHMINDSGRGYRRVVSSPMPKEIVEIKSIKALVDVGHTVITVGGGGIPVIRQTNGMLKGVPAVIDKDLAAEKLAELLKADILLILTSVPQVAINFNTPEQKNLKQVTVAEAKTYIDEGHFAPGSMLPKIKAVVKFVESDNNRQGIIASLEDAGKALKGEAGTRIVL